MVRVSELRDTHSQRGGPMNGNILFTVAAPAIVAFAAVAHAADPYPIRTIRIVVATSPGASADVAARLVAQPLAQRLGQQVVVENRAGGATMIGSDMVAK